MASAWSGGRARRKESTRAVDIAIPDTTAARKECRSRGAEIGKGVGIRIMLRPATKWTREQWAILEMDCNSVRDHGPNWLDTKIVKPK
jgi:hypothetical protein